MTFMRQAIYILVLLALSNASLNNKYALNYGSSRSIMSVMMEVENNLKLNGPLETVHGVLNNFKNAVGQEQIQHDEINQLQKSECDSEIDYRGIEVRDAQRSLETANGLLKTANKLVLKASSTLAETQNIITQTQQHINIINDVRKEDTQSYNRIVVSFNDALNTIDDALDLTGEIANGHIQLSQVAQITSQMLRHAIKLQKTQQFAPVMKSLAQFGETQEYERLNELLTTLRKHIEEAFSEFSNKNQVALSEFTSQKYTFESSLERLTKVEKRLSDKLEHQHGIISVQTAAAQAALNKRQRNSILLQDATVLCDSFDIEYASTTEGRRAELVLVAELERLVERRFAEHKD